MYRVKHAAPVSAVTAHPDWWRPKSSKSDAAYAAWAATVSYTPGPQQGWRAARRGVAEEAFAFSPLPPSLERGHGEAGAVPANCG